MNSRYLPHTDEDLRQMLHTIGVSSFADLVKHVPAELRSAKITEPKALSESELLERYRSLSRPAEARSSFVGAGLYHHSVPCAVDALISRGEFFTAYTPYQPEASQGTLQAIFEFQTVAAELLALDVANASMYDVSSAAAEAVLLALRMAPKRRRVLLSAGVHPDTLEVIRTYVASMNLTVELVPLSDGRTDLTALDAMLTDDVACVLVQSPNCLGQIEAVAKVSDLAHARQALSIQAVTDPTSLGLLRPPGACGVDIAVAEGTGMGITPSFGGPGLGLFACREQFMRTMPGRLVGETRDADNRIGYVLTLATREQHIRREKATSNICTNHGLCALAFTIHASLMGPKGLRLVGEQNVKRASYAVQKLEAAGFKRRYQGAFYNEFVLDLGAKVEAAIAAGMKRNVVVGFDLGRWQPDWQGGLLVNVTEMHTKAKLDELVEILKEAVK